MTDFDFEKRDVSTPINIPYSCISIDLSTFLLELKLAFLKNENPALAGLLVCGELWGCAQSLESVVATSENKSLNPPRFLEAEI